MEFTFSHTGLWLSLCPRLSGGTRWGGAVLMLAVNETCFEIKSSASVKRSFTSRFCFLPSGVGGQLSLLLNLNLYFLEQSFTVEEESVLKTFPCLQKQYHFLSSRDLA